MDANAPAASYLAPRVEEVESKDEGESINSLSAMDGRDCPLLN